MNERERAFQTLMDALIAREGTAQKLAEAIDMSPTAILRAAHQQFTLNVENCLRLAAHAGEDPLKVLRLAGKESQAALLENLFGNSRPAITDMDRQLLALPSGVKKHLLRLVAGLEEAAAEGKSQKRQSA